MRILHWVRIVGSVAAIAAFAAGCGRVTDVTVYEPGVYKGAKDPLLAKHASAEHKTRLQERFSTGQADR
jgi:hypothetical protein